MDQDFLEHLRNELDSLRKDGLYKAERVIASPQGPIVSTAGPGGKDRAASGNTSVTRINLCANDYLGLANHPVLVEAARRALSKHGFGMASVRFICGTQTLHKELEAKLASFLSTEDAILYSSCFDANGGLFETLLDENDAIVSDALNHASIIDGIRLCKAQRYRYANNDMNELEARLREAKAAGARRILIATDGVFSMDGMLADLPTLCDLAERYGAMTMVDDSHAVGVVGPRGRGTPEHHSVVDRIDIVTGTLGKALGGASGGYVASRKEVVEWLRQRSRPYLFSNTLAPMIAAASIACLDLLEKENGLRARLHDNARRFRAGMATAGFLLGGAGHPIVPVMLGDAKVASEMAERLLAKGLYVVGFSFPVVPKDKARIRTQLSAAHEPEHIDRAIAAFIEVRAEMGLG